jgi:hypothetical protein
MDLVVVILVEFLLKDLLGWFDLIDVFSDTGSNQMVLEPAVGSFHLPFGLGGEGIGDFHIAILQNLLPLRRGLVGQEVVFSPIGVSPLDKSEDGMGVHIVGVRESIAKDNGLKSQDMGPAGFCSDQSCIKYEPAIIIQGSDEVPFFLGGGCPEMMGGVMLD